jgi:hypothetical protein
VRVVVAVVVALLAGCTTTISGSGQAGTPTSLPPLPPAHPSTSIRRVPLAGPYGDLATANPCAGISMRAFSRWGLAQVHGWQTATTCYIDVSLYSGGFLQLNTWAESSVELDRTASRAHPRGHNVSVYTYAVDGQDCERALQLDTVVLETHTLNVRGRPSHRVLCGAVSVLIAQELAAFRHGPFPRRSLARSSLTRFDFCALVARAHYHRIRGFAGGFTDTGFLEGSGCQILDAPVDVSIRVAFIHLGFALRGRDATVRGHPLNYARYGRVCEVISVQGVTSDGRAHEILDVQARGHHDVHATCRAAEQLVAGMAEVADLR